MQVSEAFAEIAACSPDKLKVLLPQLQCAISPFLISRTMALLSSTARYQRPRMGLAGLHAAGVLSVPCAASLGLCGLLFGGHSGQAPHPFVEHMLDDAGLPHHLVGILTDLFRWAGREDEAGWLTPAFPGQPLKEHPAVVPWWLDYKAKVNALV